MLPLPLRTVVYGLSLLVVPSSARAENPIDRPAIPREPRLSHVAWHATSFLGQRQIALRDGTLPSMTAVMLGTERSHFVENFRIAAGLSTGRHRGPGWNDGDTYKWLEAMTAEYAVSGSKERKRQIDDAISIIVAAQREDGYLHTPVLIARRNGDSNSVPFGDPGQFEMYNFGHLMTAACLHHQVTGEETLLRAAVKAADFLDREFSQPDKQAARHAICPAHYMGLIELAAETGDDRYIHLAGRLMEMRDLIQGGDDNQDRVPFRQQREAVGHAVRANYLYAGAADLYLQTRDASLRLALDSLWISVQTRKVYITGGCGALFDGASPDGFDKQSQITRIHQAYGRNYQLPNSTAHNETCAAVGYVLWNHRMWKLSRDMKYIDALENSLLNAVTAGTSLDGKRFFYTNTLRQLNDMPTDLRWSRLRQEWISCYCCPPNAARLIASAGRCAYAVDEGDLVVLLYGENTFDETSSGSNGWKVRQHTTYPSPGPIRLDIESVPPGDRKITLRLPGWCAEYSLKVNGDEQQVQSANGRLTVARDWNAGDRIELDLKMPVRMMQAHPLVEECRGQTAVMRGPLVYCLESIDLPQGMSLHEVMIPTTNRWQPTESQQDLPGVALLEGDVILSRAADSSLHKENSPSLYREIQPSASEKYRVTWVPYFAWGNRGPSEMSVWNLLQP